MLGIRDSAATYRIGLDMHTSFVIQPCIFISSDWRDTALCIVMINEKIAPYQNIAAGPAYLQFVPYAHAIQHYVCCCYQREACTIPEHFPSACILTMQTGGGSMGEQDPRYVLLLRTCIGQNDTTLPDRIDPAVKSDDTHP